MIGFKLGIILEALVSTTLQGHDLVHLFLPLQD